MSAVSGAAVVSRPRFADYLLVQAACLGDALAVYASVVVVRVAMAKSLLFDAAAPQWEMNRYVVVGAVGALLYVLLAWAGRLYAVAHSRPRTHLPFVNLVNCAALLAAGLFACGRYADQSDGGVLVSRRALFFAVTIAYVLTTMAHYGLASALARRRGRTLSQESA